MRCLRVPVKKEQGTRLQRLNGTVWSFILWAVFLQLLFAERALSVSTCFTFMRFQIFVPESLLVPPRTPGVGHSAASPQHYSFTSSPLCRITGSLRPILIPLFQKSSCSHSKRRRRLYIKRWQRLTGPNARSGVTEHHNSGSVNWKSVSFSGA